MEINKKKQAVLSCMISRLQSKECSVGSTIAMVGELSEKFELSRYHVQQALTELYRRNLIVCRKKGGIIAVRELFEREKRQIISFDSGKILIVNHIPMTQPWKIVHLNEHFFSALLTPLEAAGYTVVRENIPLIQDEKELHLYIENLIRLHAPKAITVIAGGRDFERIQEMYYLCHNNVFIFTRSGFLKGGGLLSTFGIANCLDGTAAAEAAFSSGASRVIFCYRTSLYVQLWQQERRAGVQLYLRMRKNGPVFVDDFHFSNDLPQGLLRPDTALIAHNDELAAEIIDAAGKAGYTAGKDYKIIGFGDDARFRDYDLTTMRPDLPTIGRRIAEAVLDSCRSFGPIPVQATLTPSILVRRSTL